MISASKKAFWIPLAVSEMLFALNWIRDPYAYVGDRPKFVMPIWFDLGVGLLVGSVAGGLSLAIYYLIAKHRKKGLTGGEDRQH